VVSHTHWDREWYASFERFRRRLVFLLDELLEVLETMPEYRIFFTLDGTCSLIDDYLELRPENRDRLARLTASGRIVLGPWYTMPDEFLVSGESLIRNLTLGMKMAKEWGALPMKCGYLPDVFGHAPQLPQILGHLGIGSALLYRGIGDFQKDLFDWKAPDGSTVLVFKLDAERSYSSFYFALRWPFDGRPRTDVEALERANKLVEHLAAHSGSDALLSMDGVDHIEIDREVPALLAMLNEKMEGVKFRQSTISEYGKAKAILEGWSIVPALYRSSLKVVRVPEHLPSWHCLKAWQVNCQGQLYTRKSWLERLSTTGIRMFPGGDPAVDHSTYWVPTIRKARLRLPKYFWVCIGLPD
jgi:alpha-mannosidase/mannosylglycerate hydrolase